jgi:flavodoxin
MGCSADTPQGADEFASVTRSLLPAGTGVSVLLAYFSRAGENYHYGGRKYLEVGNTEILAGLISSRIACDVYRIEVAVPYSDDYDDTVARNVREQDADARPAIANPLPALDGYDTVLLGSGISNVRPPMIMRTFAEGLDLTGKTVLPVVTHAVSGLGRAPEEYAQACPSATVGEGLAVRGEEVRQAGSIVSSWLRRVDLR